MGKYYRSIADKMQIVIELGGYTIQTMSGHKGPVTSVVLSNCGLKCFSASKDNSVIMWDLSTNKKTILRPSWSRKSNPVKQSCEGEVLALAISSDDRFLVSGGRDNIIRVFDGKVNYAQVHELKGHKDAVSSLCFQRGTYSLFSGSADRSLKVQYIYTKRIRIKITFLFHYFSLNAIVIRSLVNFSNTSYRVNKIFLSLRPYTQHWDLGEMGYIETLFGHQDGVQAMDCLDKGRPISSSADRSVRLWKVAEESHLVFRGHKAAAVSAASTEHLVVGNIHV